MGRRKLNKKKRITSITLNEDVYNTIIHHEENVSVYIEKLIIIDLTNKKILK
jgi:hypothetical protein